MCLEYCGDAHYFCRTLLQATHSRAIEQGIALPSGLSAVRSGGHYLVAAEGISGQYVRADCCEDFAIAEYLCTFWLPPDPDDKVVIQ